METNHSPLKRSFARVASATYPSPGEVGCNSYISVFVEESSGRERTVPIKRRALGLSQPKMPIQAGSSPLPVAFPSFMSVFGVMNSNLKSGSREEEAMTTQTSTHSTNNFNLLAVPQPSPSFQHRGSISSIQSESTESSPTTTFSTFDSPLATDASPGSSPESPSSIPSGYPKPMTLPDTTERETLPVVQDVLLSPLPPLPSPIRAISPGRRARNLKNLSLKVPTPLSRPSISTASVMETGSHHLSAPPSPVIRPTKAIRRRPANLTIRTPALDKAFLTSIADMVPPTPHIRPSLRHIESSPSLASIFSPTVAPAGGMQLPRPSTRDGMRTMPGAWQEDVSPQSPTTVQNNFTFREILQNVEEEDQHLDSREPTKKSERGYPDGPIQIYDSGIYLYLEPTVEEAAKFDVVVNVAKEVPNPFSKSDRRDNTVVSTLRNASVPPSKRQSLIEPQTAISEISFHSAFEFIPSVPATPTTPTTPKPQKPQPEYVHVNWDHNSEILDDLYPLCELIDDRVSKGKTVLIHCQLGVSRSASMVIAYGLYKNPHLDFNAMYGIVKSKSNWVGPNMSLIYQLTDFRSRVLSGGPSKPPPAQWFEPNVDDSGGSRLQPIQNPPQQSSLKADIKTSEDDPFGLLSPAPFLNPLCNRGPTVRFPTISAPLRLSTSEAPRKHNVSPRSLPLRESFQTVDLLPNKPQPDAWKPAHRPLPFQMDLVMQDVPASPSIFSPRAAKFMATTLSRTLAGDLAGDFPPSLLDLRQTSVDPRSPPQRTEALIMRNIDEFL
ncbi:hypothetical protein Egran_03418 [Elaphomyces granulatus]|uniref:protein-tyrosine-phosphatase n=1 Tax=Elaphomyces granulatus TaxID=519963 RepID=A0A232LXC4_9EURO|nr:hypothetical protein Egran_03418 [Elaphomyces granulatus]